MSMDQMPMAEKQIERQDNREFREEIVRISRENEKEWEQLKKEHQKIFEALEETDNSNDKKGEKVMVLDYKNDQEFAFENGVKPENSLGETHFVAEDTISNVTFRNFKNLCLEDACFEDCVFENCTCVTTESCHMEMCTFKNVDSIDGVRTDFSNCTFKDCCSDGPFLCIDSHGCVENCTFDTITALDDSQGYVIYSVYGKKKEVEFVSGCKFINCQVENEEAELCYCSYFKPFSSFNTIQVDNVDYDTCQFENCGPIEV